MLIILVRIVGIYSAAAGAIVMLNPKAMKAMLAFFMQGKRYFLAGVIRLVLGVVFLYAGLKCRKPIVILIFGVLMLAGSAAVFLLGEKGTKKVLAWFSSRTAMFMRSWGLLALAIGALILYSA